MAWFSRTTNTADDTLRHMRQQRGAALANADQRAMEAGWAPTPGSRARLLGKAASERREAKRLGKEIRRSR